MNCIKTDSGQGSPEGTERNPPNPFNRSAGTCDKKHTPFLMSLNDCHKIHGHWLR